MAETSSKRQREEILTHVQDLEEDPKRQKSYNHILSILEDEEDEPNQDLSSILTTLQQELSPDFSLFDPLPGPTSESDPDNHSILSSTTTDYSPSDGVLRHLLEASDDELGIPHKLSDGDGDDEINGGDHSLALCDGLWEIEDEAANYYALLQSELFM